MIKVPKYVWTTTFVVATLGIILLLRKGLRISSNSWSKDDDFFYVPSIGKNLAKIGKSVGINMVRNKGRGGKVNMESYKSLKTKPSIYWAVYDVSGDRLIAASGNAKKNIYAASTSKAVVVATALNNNGGKLPSDADYGKAIRLLVISDNNMWTPLQTIAGGAGAVNKFSKEMGYEMNPARSGGNNINAIGMCEFWRDTLRGKYQGAEIVYKITSSCQTSTLRSRKYIPTTCYIGSKTGTYSTFSHDSAWIQDGDRFYSISVLTDKNNGSEQVATMFGGLFNEYIKG